MADNTQLNTGAGGDVVASDDISGVKFQRIKLIHGIDGINDGDIAGTNPLPVKQTDFATFIGTACTFRTPGRAGTAGQKILSLHNATGSSKIVTVRKVSIDIVATVIKAVTVLPPVIRLYKVTVLPTNGTALTKVKTGGSSTSNASITVLGDASADGTGSGTTLTATLPGIGAVAQEYAARLITAAGYEMSDRVEFKVDIVLAALEGVVVMLDYVLATQNPVTDMWIASIEWAEN